MNETRLLQGRIDTHIHSAPDIRQRKMSDLDLMEEAVKQGLRGVVIKSHHMPTVARALVINELCHKQYGADTNFQMFGGITLNRYVGGINPWAVESSLMLGGKIVWLPTVHALQQTEREKKPGGIRCVQNGKPVPELLDVLHLVKQFDAVLATSHLSPKEIFVVVEAARNLGIKQILISHPESNLVGLTLNEQKRLVTDYDVILERCYAQPIGGGKYQSNLEDNERAIQEIGAEHIILATDGGQIENPFWYDALGEMITYLADGGISEQELDRMTKENPASMLGIITGR